MEIFDLNGNPFIEGDTVVYPTRRGSTLAMTRGTIEAITADGKLKIRRRAERINGVKDNTYIPSFAPLVTVNPVLAVVC